MVLKSYCLRLVSTNKASIKLKQRWLVGGPEEVRTLDLMTARRYGLGYLIDFAARLATQEHRKARREHSSGTDLVLVFLLSFCHNNCPIPGEVANQIMPRIVTELWRQGCVNTSAWLRELDLNQRPLGYEPN